MKIATKRIINPIINAGFVSSSCGRISSVSWINSGTAESSSGISTIVESSHFLNISGSEQLLSE